jgi:3-methyladenine DNA glycosylase AlkC
MRLLHWRFYGYAEGSSARGRRPSALASAPAMAEPLKNFFSRNVVRRLADDIVSSYPRFPKQAFVRRATKGLEDLELLDRGRHISNALAACLPPAYPEAIEIILGSLGPAYETDEVSSVGMTPFYYLPHVTFVAERGLDHFDLSMKAQYELTKRFTAESSIRPYIEQYPDRTMAVLSKWTRDSDAHVRRLVSEGTRLRLPWAPRVPWLDDNPERILERRPVPVVPMALKGMWTSMWSRNRHPPGPDAGAAAVPGAGGGGRRNTARRRHRHRGAAGGESTRTPRRRRLKAPRRKTEPHEPEQHL